MTTYFIVFTTCFASAAAGPPHEKEEDPPSAPECLRLWLPAPVPDPRLQDPEDLQGVQKNAKDIVHSIFPIVHSAWHAFQKHAMLFKLFMQYVY